MPARHRLFSLIAPALLVAGVACTMTTPAVAPASNAVAPAASTDSTASPALPSADDLTFGEAAGNVLIGLTVRPAQPGPNTLLVYVAPLAGPSAAADVPLTLTLDGQNVDLESCSRTCRTADVNLVGGEHVDVVAGGAGGGSAGFNLPPLPAVDGTALLQQVQDRMHQLNTYRVAETLGPATPLLQASYAFQAPDRMQLTPSKGESTVWVGPTRYTREPESDTWQSDNFGTSLSVPSFIWDVPKSGGAYAGPHIVGSETVDGVQTQLLSFFLDLSQTPAWFRLSVDGTGLVHRASMRAQGHFMDHVYSDFDAPISIEAPV